MPCRGKHAFRTSGLLRSFMSATIFPHSRNVVETGTFSRISNVTAYCRPAMIQPETHSTSDIGSKRSVEFFVMELK